MSSQMFWLLSYVSLGLALSLGNRGTSVHSTSSQQQKQQSTSSAQKSSRQEAGSGGGGGVGASGAGSSGSGVSYSSTRDQALRTDESAGPVVEFDNIRSYVWDEPSANFNDMTNDWRFSSDYSRQREFLLGEKSTRSRGNFVGIDNDEDGEIDASIRDSDVDVGVENEERRRRIRENGFFDDFATAVLDSLSHPRKGEFLVAAKAPNIRKSYEDTEFFEKYADAMGATRDPRSGKRSKSARAQRDYPKKSSGSPIFLYRNENTVDNAPYAPIKNVQERGKTPRIAAIGAESNRPNQWPNGAIAALARGNDDFTKRRNNDNDNSWMTMMMMSDHGASETGAGGHGIEDRAKTLGKRNPPIRGRSSNDPRGWTTGNGQQSSQTSAANIPGSNIASQFLLRSARGTRQYDVPQIECPPSEDGMERFACPTPDRMGRYRCIDDHVLCDGFIDCPTAEDEDRQACMFYKTTKAHLDVLAEALLRWARGR